MHSIFTPELIARCQKIYSKRSGLDMTAEQADRILTQLAAYGDLVARVHGWTEDEPVPDEPTRTL